jgi:hypothetical protein
MEMGYGGLLEAARSGPAYEGAPPVRDISAKQIDDEATDVMGGQDCESGSNRPDRSGTIDPSILFAGEYYFGPNYLWLLSNSVA